MNTHDTMKYGHLTFKQALECAPEDQCEQPGACGTWSVKDIVAHLASYEVVLVDVLQSVLDAQAATPVLDKFLADYEGFNDREVELRRPKSFGEVQQEYEEHHARAMELLGYIPAERFWQNGLLAWYGSEYDLDDFLVYTYYGHKREHSAQIAAFCDHIKIQEVTFHHD